MMNRYVRRIAAAAALVCVGTAAAAQPQNEDVALERMLSGQSYLQGADLERALEAAAAHPLGARENPVRASTPAGQRAYLARLRCADGRAPQFERNGNLGAGVYGNIIDSYSVQCANSQPAEATIIMDMYHRGHVEQRPVPGFTITPG